MKGPSRPLRVLIKPECGAPPTRLVLASPARARLLAPAGWLPAVLLPRGAAALGVHGLPPGRRAVVHRHGGRCGRGLAPSGGLLVLGVLAPTWKRDEKCSYVLKGPYCTTRCESD